MQPILDKLQLQFSYKEVVSYNLDLDSNMLCAHLGIETFAFSYRVVQFNSEISTVYFQTKIQILTANIMKALQFINLIALINCVASASVQPHVLEEYSEKLASELSLIIDEVKGCSTLIFSKSPLAKYTPSQRQPAQLHYFSSLTSPKCPGGFWDKDYLRNGTTVRTRHCVYIIVNVQDNGIERTMADSYFVCYLKSIGRFISDDPDYRVYLWLSNREKEQDDAQELMNRFNKPRFQNVAVKYMSRQGNASVTGNWHFLCQFCHPSYTLIILKPIQENVQFNIKLFRNWIGHNFASRLWELYKGLGQFNTKDIVLQRFHTNNTVSSRIGISHVQTYAISENVEHYFLLNLVLDHTNSTLESNIRMDLPKIRLYSNIFEVFSNSICLDEVCFQKMVHSNVKHTDF
jgi:hypothetical protein